MGVSYTLDIFGGLRRQLEAVEAHVEFQKFQLEGAYLALTANIVTTAISEASLRLQIRATQDIIASQETLLNLVEKRYEAGAVPQTDVLAQRAQLAQLQTALPALEKALAQTRHQLAVLAGQLPSEMLFPKFELSDLILPQELPVSLPSVLVRQRPDIQAAEALLHASSAQVGAATADLYPKITLTGGYGFTSNIADTLFDHSSVVWNFGAGLLQPLFHGKALTAKRQAAIAVYEQALSQYRLTVLQAFQNVADVLRALETDAAELKAQAAAEKAACDLLELARQQFQAGAVSYLTLLNAQRQQQEARIGLVQAQAARFADTAALFQAMGGGWWNRDREGQNDANTMVIKENVR